MKDVAKLCITEVQKHFFNHSFKAQKQQKLVAKSCIELIMTMCIQL